jgi:two-component system phosphate regulon response regulator PhoB
MPKETILVVDDEQDILELVEYNLARNGYQVSCVRSGEDALRAARSQVPDLILLDLMLPGIDGFDVCKILKNDARTAAIPIIILSARGEEADIVTGLELGADDYITKPFSPRILVARTRTVLRKHTQEVPADTAVIRRGDLVVDPGRREVLAAEKPVELTFTEFSILHFLIRRPGWVFTRNQIIDAVRGGDYPVTERSVDVQIVSLRRKLGPCGGCIDTVRGVGYRFKDSSV